MRNETFQTPDPVQLIVEIGSGSVQLDADDVERTDIAIEGSTADDVTVTQDGRTIRVEGPRARLFSGDQRLDVRVTLPVDSDARVATGSAQIVTTGRFGTVDTRTGSGSVEVDSVAGQATAKTGSGAVRFGAVEGEARIKTGSGSVEMERCAGNCVVATGSGSVRLGVLGADAEVKTGSGQLRIEQASGRITSKSGSGSTDVRELRSGRLQVKGASGDVTVGVPEGTPVWADVRAVSGTIRNSLPSTGAPAEGQSHVELQINTVSGDITVRPV